MPARAKQIKSTSDLKPDPRNVNMGTPYGAKVIQESLQAYGAGRSIVTDRLGVVIGGNKTLEGATSVGITKTRVVQTTGDELVVVQRMDLDLEKSPVYCAVTLERMQELGLEPKLAA